MAADAISNSVLAAFAAWGFLKALTPFAIASTPVRALEPEAKARSSTKMVTAPVPAGSGLGATACGGDPSRHSTSPTPISTSIATMKPYVGSAKAMPLSRTPRRLTKVISTIASDAQPHVPSREPRNGGGNREDPARDGHRDGEHVVDEQRRAGNQRRQRAEVVLGDHVRAAARLVGADDLRIGERRRRQEHGDDDRDGEDEVEGFKETPMSTTIAASVA